MQAQTRDQLCSKFELQLANLLDWILQTRYLGTVHAAQRGVQSSVTSAQQCRTAYMSVVSPALSTRSLCGTYINSCGHSDCSGGVRNT